MSFFAILIALLLEQARPLAHDNRVHAGLRGWARMVRRNLDTGQSAHGWTAWALAVGVPALVAGLVYWGLWQFSTVMAFVWMVGVLYVTLGFRQFSHHFSEIRLALDVGDDAAARDKLAQWLQVDASSLPRTELLRQVIEHSVLSAHRHVFGVLVAFVVFWVLGLGPAGAVFYRMAEYLSRNWRARPNGAPSEALHQAAALAWQWVDLLPARVTALGFAIVGNFEEAVASWRGDAERFAPGSDGVVLAATSGAINVRLAPQLEMNGTAEDADSSLRPDPQLAHLGSVVGLVWRTVVLWMLLLALLTLARLVG
ncbi:MAG: CobD/CbiB family protein [Hydrogenophaga sp.]|uniref:CobD/CbiB family protein n=1 Tax=Hydrogenophaga sp. TaxID=1904254 RepID=UPI001BBD4145|nr:CobD/CbiB family protein [Hydrogenophaga sp.]MBS3912417.1 CobD/CbiB family protein [Hydrogenophaga sp.]MDO9133267.1 CobD/CbiB family protein [Hydrogenophaga sp.]MDO9606098.1 CobD/CbiB family protein [Hydrogenophaga sp.]